MSVTVAVTNMGLSPFSMKGFTTLAAAPTVTKTKVVKTVTADDASVNLDRVAKFGVYVTENGTARPGSVVVTTTATVTSAQYLVIVDITANFTLTLPALAGLAAQHPVVVFMRSRTAGTLTIDADGAETINGAANTTLAVAGGIVRLQKDSATNWVTQTA